MPGNFRQYDRDNSLLTIQSKSQGSQSLFAVSKALLAMLAPIVPNCLRLSNAIGRTRIVRRKVHSQTKRRIRYPSAKGGLFLFLHRLVGQEVQKVVENEHTGGYLQCFYTSPQKTPTVTKIKDIHPQDA